jgi:hypothetical protein
MTKAAKYLSFARTEFAALASFLGELLPATSLFPLFAGPFFSRNPRSAQRGEFDWKHILDPAVLLMALFYGRKSCNSRFSRLSGRMLYERARNALCVIK